MIDVKLMPILAKRATSRKEQLGIPFVAGLTPGQIAESEGFAGHDLEAILAVVNGDQVELDRVLLLENEGEVVVGSPTIDGAKVLAHVLGQPRGPKLTVFKFKAKVR